MYLPSREERSLDSFIFLAWNSAGLAKVEVSFLAEPEEEEGDVEGKVFVAEIENEDVEVGVDEVVDFVVEVLEEEDDDDEVEEEEVGGCFLFCDAEGVREAFAFFLFFKNSIRAVVPGGVTGGGRVVTISCSCFGSCSCPCSCSLFSLATMVERKAKYPLSRWMVLIQA